MPAAPASFTSPETVAALQAAATSGGNDFKAIICIFLFGGNDAHQMLVPRGTGSNAAVYRAARPYNPATSPVTDNVGIGENEGPNLHPINADYRFHPQMVNMFQAWQDGKLAVVREVGTLNQPTTKAMYFADQRNRPDQLFAHNIQQDQWQAADMPYTPRVTGWFGRAANLMDLYYNAGATNAISGMSSIAGERLQLYAYDDKRPSVFGASNTVPVQVMPTGASMGVTGFNSIRDGMYEKDLAASFGYVHRNAIHQMMREHWNSARVSQSLLNTTLQALPAAVGTAIDAATPAVTLGGVFGQANPLREAIKVATRIMLSRGASHFNHRRQIIFLQMGGFDNHNNLRRNHDPLVVHLDNAIKAFRDAMAHPDVNLTNNVTLFFETEFGRTMQSNGTGGTDHGWSNHSFVVGGPVVGGLYGPSIDYTLGGPFDTGNPGSSALGRYIPQISIEQYYAEILRWFGLPESVMPLALPNYGAFSNADLGFLP